MLMTVQDEESRVSTEDGIPNNGSDSSIVDLLDSDEEDNLQQEGTLCYALQAYSIVDPIPIDLTNHCYGCNDILDKNANKLQELIVWAYKQPSNTDISRPVLSGNRGNENLKKVLSVVNDPLFNNHLFWDWLSQLSNEKLLQLYTELKENA